MPIYEYQCNDCCQIFETLVVSLKDYAPVCPECGCDKVTKLMSAGSVRANGIPKGSGGFKPPACKPSGG